MFGVSSQIEDFRENKIFIHKSNQNCEIYRDKKKKISEEAYVGSNKWKIAPCLQMQKSNIIKATLPEWSTNTIIFQLRKNNEMFNDFLQRLQEYVFGSAGLGIPNNSGNRQREDLTCNTARLLWNSQWKASKAMMQERRNSRTEQRLKHRCKRLLRNTARKKNHLEKEKQINKLKGQNWNRSQFPNFASQINRKCWNVSIESKNKCLKQRVRN